MSACDAYPYSPLTRCVRVLTRSKHNCRPRKRIVATRKCMAAPGVLAKFRAFVAHVGRAVFDLVTPMGSDKQTGFCYGNEPVANPGRSRREVRI